MSVSSRNYIYLRALSAVLVPLILGPKALQYIHIFIPIVIHSKSDCHIHISWYTVEVDISTKGL
ncbi:hypothetical protein L211DRAFT_250922 [Terfezia boudieri ATCC MYA-4762]|uniref:Uncharacterized protein n=1 Tax=Terfezia boudieri ATCC MYA-4762 TaxID=1051890 RepID=A0A3N4M1B9_9PEZI|nr:hypothetical protein L211DRAFT_250922 [Terfezia boudieri ATCC MYA-4762]